MRRAVVLGAVLALAWAFPTTALGAGDPDVAALQVALGHRGLYHGTIDGSLGAPLGG